MKKLKLLFILFLGIAGAAWARPTVRIVPQGDTTHTNSIWEIFRTPVDYIKVASGDNLTLKFFAINAEDENYTMWDILKADTIKNDDGTVKTLKDSATLTITDINNIEVVEQYLSDSSVQINLSKGLYKLELEGQFYNESTKKFGDVKTEAAYLMVGDADRIVSIVPQNGTISNSTTTFTSHTLTYSVDYIASEGGYLTAELLLNKKVVYRDTAQNKQISFENVSSVNASGSAATYQGYLYLHKANGDTLMTISLYNIKLDVPLSYQLLPDSLPAHTLSADTLKFDAITLREGLNMKFAWMVDTLNWLKTSSYNYYALWATVTDANGKVVAGPDTLGFASGSGKGSFGYYPYKEVSLPTGIYMLRTVLMKSSQDYDDDLNPFNVWEKDPEQLEDTIYILNRASLRIDKLTTSTHTVLANGTWNFRKTNPTFGWVLDEQIADPKNYAVGVSVLNAEGEAWVAEDLLVFGDDWFATDDYSVTYDPILPDTSYQGYRLAFNLQKKGEDGKLAIMAGSEDTITFNVQVLKVKMVPQQSYTSIEGNWKNDKVTFMSFAKDTKPEIKFETENCYMSETLNGSGETKLTIVPMGGKTREIALTDSVYQLEVGNDSLYKVTFEGYFTGVDITTTIYIRIGDAPLMSFEPAGLYDTATYTNRGTIKFTTRDAAFNVNVEAAEGSYTIANLIKYMNYKKEPMGADTVKDGKVSFKNLINDATYIVDFNVYSAEGVSLTSLSGNRFYVEDPTVAASVLFAPAFNADTTYTDSVEVTLTCYTSGATIKYSIDGSVPSLTYTKPIVLKETATIKAFAEKEGRRNSDTLGCLYNVETTGEPTVANQSAAKVDFAVYPNPNSGQFTVEVAESAVMEIYNAAGIRVLRSTVPAGKRTVRLSASGIYFVKMTAEGKTTVKRVIVR